MGKGQELYKKAKTLIPGGTSLLSKRPEQLLPENWPAYYSKSKGCHVWDSKGNEYLDLYGGHAVISVGHCHPTYVAAITDQLQKLGFYSNSVINHLQQTFADKLGKACGYDDYALFLVNSVFLRYFFSCHLAFSCVSLWES